LYTTGVGHSVIATTRSAMSSIIHIPGCSRLSDHPLVTRLMKGIYNNRPPVPKYTNVWNVDDLFSYLKTLQSNSFLSLKMLTLKLAVLLGILSGQRVSTIHKFDVTNMDISHEQVIFHVNNLLKHTKLGKPNKPFVYKVFPSDLDLCVVTCLNDYISRRKNLVQNCNNLFITYGKPHHPASKDTVARWIKEMLSLSGIDVKTFGPHSIRSASTSKASSIGVPIATILQYGQWKKTSTFYKYYKKDIINSDNVINNVDFDVKLLEEFIIKVTL